MNQIVADETYKTGLKGERPWGRWFVLDVGVGYCVKRIEVLPGQRLSLQYHHHRMEDWTVISGSGRVLVGSTWTDIAAGTHIHIPQGDLHRVANTSDEDLIILELQRGSCDEEDIVRVEDDYAR